MLSNTITFECKHNWVLFLFYTILPRVAATIVYKLETEFLFLVQVCGELY